MARKTLKNDLFTGLLDENEDTSQEGASDSSNLQPSEVSGSEALEDDLQDEDTHISRFTSIEGLDPDADSKPEISSVQEPNRAPEHSVAHFDFGKISLENAPTAVNIPNPHRWRDK